MQRSGALSGVVGRAKRWLAQRVGTMTSRWSSW